MKKPNMKSRQTPPASLYKKLIEKNMPLEDLGTPTASGAQEMSAKELARQEMMSDMAANAPDDFHELQVLLNEVKKKKLGQKDIDQLIRMRAGLEQNGRAPQSGAPAFAENVPLPEDKEAMLRFKKELVDHQNTAPSAFGGGLTTEYNPHDNIDAGAMPFNQAQLMLKQIRGEMRTPQDMADHAEGMLDTTIEKGKKAKTVKNLLKNVEELTKMQQGTDAPYP